MTEETIFLAALQKQNAAERAAYLETACGGNVELRQRVEALLRAHQNSDSCLDVSAPQPQARPSDEPTHTQTLGESAAGLPPLAGSTDAGALGRLDHYEVLEVVGRGGMGVVYKARDTKLQRIVAIKTLAPQLAADGTARKRFVREAQAAAAVRDDHVVSIHAVNDEGLVPYLVMEFIAGTTLAERLQHDGPLEVKEILRIGLQAAAGLAAAHKQGLVHRDIKPSNILLENGVQRVKLTDFGLARAAADAGLSQSGVVAGTPQYMSPEQARGEAVDQRSDLFSLGAVLYTVCTGRPAFRADHSLAVLKRVCEDEPRPIRATNPDIPEWLATVVGKLLAKDPGQRFQSAAEVAEVLGRHLARLQQAEFSEGRQTASVPRAAPRKRPRPALLLGLVGALALLVGVAVLVRPWLFPPADDQKPPAKAGTPPDGKQGVPPVEVGVLTVSQKAEDGGKFRTIQEALDAVEPGKTIRVLDEAVYEEQLMVNRPGQHRDVVLEAAGKATLRLPPVERTCSVHIGDVPNFTLRGFHLESTARNQVLVFITRACPGLVLDRLELVGHPASVSILLSRKPAAPTDAPVVIQRCQITGGLVGILFEGRERGTLDTPSPIANVVIRDNTLHRCHMGVTLMGVVQRAQVVGNRFRDTGAALNIEHLLEGTADVLVANNTMLGNQVALQLYDDHTRGKEFLKCKNVRVQNNLVLTPRTAADFYLANQPRESSSAKAATPGDVTALLESPGWRFGHNWRELTPPRKGPRDQVAWIPECPGDKLQLTIQLLSRDPGDPNFLRPPKDSPLGTAGVGGGTLPGYVGAVPPVGIEPWDWDKTWKASVR